MSRTDKPFTRSYNELVELRLSKTLVFVYGRLEFMAGDKGECWPTQATLAQKCGLQIRQLENVLKQLRRLKLIQWKRGRYYNRYRVLKPDTQWIADLIRNGLRISDPQRITDRKESSSKEHLKANPFPPNPPFPTAEPKASNAKPTAGQPRTNANTNAKPKISDDDDPNTPPNNASKRACFDAMDTNSALIRPSRPLRPRLPTIRE
jgi:hypothetical protein